METQPSKPGVPGPHAGAADHISSFQQAPLCCPTQGTIPGIIHIYFKTYDIFVVCLIL